MTEAWKGLCHATCYKEAFDSLIKRNVSSEDRLVWIEKKLKAILQLLMIFPALYIVCLFLLMGMVMLLLIITFFSRGAEGFLEAIARCMEVILLK